MAESRRIVSASEKLFELLLTAPKDMSLDVHPFMVSLCLRAGDNLTQIDDWALLTHLRAFLGIGRHRSPLQREGWPWGAGKMDVTGNWHPTVEALVSCAQLEGKAIPLGRLMCSIADALLLQTVSNNRLALMANWLRTGVVTAQLENEFIRVFAVWLRSERATEPWLNKTIESSHAWLLESNGKSLRLAKRQSLWRHAGVPREVMAIAVRRFTVGDDKKAGLLMSQLWPE